MAKVLTYIGRDGRSRPVYEDENEKLWKDTDCRAGWQGVLHSSYHNDFDGEPDCPMKSNIECIFIPERITD